MVWEWKNLAIFTESLLKNVTPLPLDSLYLILSLEGCASRLTQAWFSAEEIHVKQKYNYFQGNMC